MGKPLRRDTTGARTVQYARERRSLTKVSDWGEHARRCGRFATFLDQLASNAPTPGGGAASAYVGALGAASVAKVAAVSVGKPKFAAHDAELRDAPRPSPRAAGPFPRARGRRCSRISRHSCRPTGSRRRRTMSARPARRIAGGDAAGGGDAVADHGGCARSAGCGGDNREDRQPKCPRRLRCRCGAGGRRDACLAPQCDREHCRACGWRGGRGLSRATARSDGWRCERARADAFLETIRRRLAGEESHDRRADNHSPDGRHGARKCCSGSPSRRQSPKRCGAGVAGFCGAVWLTCRCWR